MPGSWRYYLAITTLLDQVNPKEYNLRLLPVILHDPFPSRVEWGIFLMTEPNIEFSRIMSKFLMDRRRTWSFWVKSQKYADLARYILERMRDK